MFRTDVEVVRDALEYFNYDSMGIKRLSGFVLGVLLTQDDPEYAKQFIAIITGSSYAEILDLINQGHITAAEFKEVVPLTNE